MIDDEHHIRGSKRDGVPHGSGDCDGFFINRGPHTIKDGRRGPALTAGVRGLDD